MKLAAAFTFALVALFAGANGLLQFENVDCDSCNAAYKFCDDNGSTWTTKKGEQQTCRDHVCYKRPECRQCPGEFTLCKDRFPQYCGNKPCA
ncbi:hypothetical protein EK21DRAFT_116576 [Setomelanomma holmii]|uniref:Uncharacterized protein n=1 Tax=Setomelanomma holmii TaxID=210430 RepID=A0A9P4H107_9PLEO|nr:hypothetical protein EK21DRAFT_116576 [Setomelanomma holmii]